MLESLGDLDSEFLLGADDASCINCCYWIDEEFAVMFTPEPAQGRVKDSSKGLQS